MHFQLGFEDQANVNYSLVIAGYRMQTDNYSLEFHRKYFIEVSSSLKAKLLINDSGGVYKICINVGR